MEVRFTESTCLDFRPLKNTDFPVDYGMLSVTIIPTRKPNPKYANTAKRALNSLNLQNQTPHKNIPSIKSYPKV